RDDRRLRCRTNAMPQAASPRNPAVKPPFALALGLILVSAPLVRAEPPADPVEEIWEVAHIDGVKVGFLHTTVRAQEVNGGKQLRASAELELTFKRNNALMKLRIEQGTEETADGKV